MDVALSSGGDFDKFWQLFDERLELCHKALMCRHNRLKGTLSDAAPILWQYGALARLKKGEPIDKLLYGGYSTISLGYAGLYECCKYMTGKSHTDPAAKPFALHVMQHMNDACAKWKSQHNIDFSLYGTPLESTTLKFSKCLQKRFGIVPGITDRSYITNSYHVHVTEKIDAFTKLKFESEFQKLSPGGAISYVEVPNMQDNLEAVIKVMQFIYENIMYAELNTKSDYCQVCGYDGEIQIVQEDGKLVWECPKCHNRDQNKLNVARRTCGYIGTQFWNQGRTAEIRIECCICNRISLAPDACRCTVLRAGGLLFCRGGIHPFRVHCASRRKINSENLRRALRCHAVGAAHVRPGTVKISTLLRGKPAGRACPALLHRIAKQADRQFLTVCLLFCSL